MNLARPSVWRRLRQRSSAVEGLGVKEWSGGFGFTHADTEAYIYIFEKNLSRCWYQLLSITNSYTLQH